MRRRVYWLLIALAILPVGAHAQTDWIDEFPSVTEVAHAAFEELKVTSAMSRLDMTGDDDSIAVNLAGTLNVLRQILYLKFIAEQPLPKAREDKLKKLVAAYLEAELTIGGGAGTRRGYITRAPSAGGQGCSAQDRACYRRWFLAHLHANTSRAEYRERFLNRLFPCGTLAKELNGLRQARAATMPYFPSPAVTLQTDGQLAGLAPAGCTAYGGDANQNGLCDDWERKPSLTELSASASSPSAPIVMDTVKLAQGGGLKVALAKWGGKLGQSVCFRVWRSDKSTVDASAQQIWGGHAPVELTADGKASLQVIVAKGQPFALDKARPYFIVELTSGKSPDTASCEIALDQWLQRQLPPKPPSGLHGPYQSADVAMQVTGKLALQMTIDYPATAEHGFMVLRDSRLPSGDYYTTAPTRSADTKKLVFQPTDYWNSLGKAFETSCEEHSNFELAATVHTHPVHKKQSPIDVEWTGYGADNNNLSIPDFEQAVQLLTMQPARFVVGETIKSQFEKIYMISEQNRCIQWFAPKPLDLHFEEHELMRNDIAPTSVALYNEYVKRQRRVCGLY